MISNTNLISKLKNCTSPKQIHQLHAFLITTGLHHDTFLLSKLIETCSKLNLSHYGYSIFNYNTYPSVYLYNTIINSLSSNLNSAKLSIFLFNKLRVVGLLPDSYTFPFVLKSVTRVLDAGVGKMVHGQLIKSGFQKDIHAVTATVKMYAACGHVDNARKVFDEMSSLSDVALWNAMVNGFAAVGDMDNARVLFEGMRVRNVISWTTMIAGYVHCGLPNDGIQVFQRMCCEGVEVDEVALLAALSACADLGALHLGEQIIHDYVETRCVRKTIPLCNALVDLYVKSGNIDKALGVFESMEHKSVVSWTTMITGLAFHGLGKEAMEMFRRMERAGVRPNEVTLIGVLTACTHGGLVELGKSYFDDIKSKYGMRPKIEHYGCMVDMLGRAGCLTEAEDVVKGMPFEANAAIWGSLLAAATKHGDWRLAWRALKCLSSLEPAENSGGNYSLVCNTYASVGQYDEARLVRKRMRRSGVKKLGGESVIEINKQGVEGFNAGKVCHPQAKEICGVVEAIHHQSKTLLLHHNELLLPSLD